MNSSNIVQLLKACRTLKDLHKGSELHAYIREHRCFEKNSYIGSALISMYARCGALAKAHQMLEELPVRDVVSWSALIGGYAQEGLGEEALKCFDDMLVEGHSPDAVTFACVLRACGSIGAATKGKEIHDKIVSLGMLEKDIVLGTTLLDMYVKCGAVAKAQEVHKELPIHDVVSWNALIAGYAQHGQGEEAMKCFDDMLFEGHIPDAVTFISSLKACGSIRAAAKGKEIHDKILSLGMLEKHVMIGNALMDMYVKCGALGEAQQVLKELPTRDVVSWSALIAGYVQMGQGKEALRCFGDMIREGHFQDAVTFICVLKACGSIGAAAKGKEVHDKIISSGMLEKDIVLGNSLVDMYMKCGALSEAHQVHEKLFIRDVVSWNALLAGYSEQGQGEEALKCFDDMLGEGHSPTVVTFICVLKACGSIRAVAKGEEIHDKIVSLGMLEKDIVLGTSLVDMYVKCDALAKAHRVHEALLIHDVASWNSLIAGYAEQGQGEIALKCFDDMLREGHSSDAVTFVCALKACGSIGAAVKGEEIHDKIASLGMLEKNIVLGNTLVDMYMKCHAFSKAHHVHKELPVRDVVSWNALISGYAGQGRGQEALKCFEDMLYEGHSSTVATFISVLKACGSIGAAAKGEEIHADIVHLGMLEKDIVLGTSLVDMYVKCGVLTKAHEVHKELPFCDLASWNALIAGYVERGKGEEALKCFNDMLCEGHSPDLVTFICVLKACGTIGAAAKGKEIHASVGSLGKMEKDIVLRRSLVDMYVKCGALAKAQCVLEELPAADAVSWNTLISGYAQQGQIVEAINCFEKMQSTGVKASSMSLTVVLNVCSHLGLLDQAATYFSGMSTKYSIHPSLEHYYCMTDAFGRAGKFNNALSVIAEMPYDKCLPSWVALLGACHKWAEVKIGRLAFRHVLCLDNANAAVYVLMGDIYTAAGIQEEAHKVELMSLLK